MTARILLAGLLCLAGCNRSHHQDEGKLSERTRDGRVSPRLLNLGSYGRKVTTGDKTAQTYFNQGLALLYGFNHAEALRSFEEAARIDPKCGMAYWGQAVALSPNINDSAIGPDREQQGYAASRKALANKGGMSAVEQSLIDAIAARFTSQEKPDRKQLNEAYAAAMKKVYDRFPDDPDVATFYADSVMNTMPWDYWAKNGTAKPPMSDAIEALERAQKISPDHPGAHHAYIHAVEASPNPDRAVPSAEKLGGLVPGAGHLVHMPSHIFIRVGRYAEGSAANRKAITADEDYITQCRAQGIYPAAYYPHNIHFLFATLAMEGKSRETIEAARKVSEKHDHGMFNEPGFGFPHLLGAMPSFALIRFGKWDEMLAEPDPGGEMAFMQVVRHFGRGYAYLAKKDIEAARKELGALSAKAKDPKLAELKIMDLNSLDKLAAIAENVLAGEIAAKQKDTARAVALLRRAIEIEDGLLYSEPPDWPLPPRHALGAVLLEAGRAKEAEKVFQEDLTRHRENGWALRGLLESLRAQKREADAAGVEARLRKAWANADVEIGSSRL